MLTTVWSQIGLITTLVVILWAAFRGNDSLRLAALSYGTISFIALVFGTLFRSDQFLFSIADLIIMGIFLRLCWKSQFTWPFWSCAAQFFALIGAYGPSLMFHERTIIPNLNKVGYIIMMISGYFVLASFVYGVFEIRSRR